MNNIVTKRNIINLLGMVAFALGIAIEMNIIIATESIQYASFIIALIGYLTNDSFNGGSE